MVEANSTFNTSTVRPNYHEQCFSEFGKITQNNGPYAVQGHRMSPIRLPIESPYTISYS